jgi:fermentation-respiration switch protein FrsA (DUF1100 family)
MVWVPAGDHRVPGTLALPPGPTGRPLPVVLLLHGDQSSRNENGATCSPGWRLTWPVEASRRCGSISPVPATLSSQI